MKKTLLFLFVLICAALVGIYLLIPPEIKFSKFIFTKTKLPRALRLLTDISKWKSWFPNDSINTLHATSNHNNFSFKNYSYTVDNILMNTAQISISNDHQSIKSIMALLPINDDSVALEWNAEINAGFNPITRIKSYKESKEIKNDMTYILKKLQTFLEKKENSYGLNISQEKVVDTILISTKYISDTYPSTEKIYSLIKDLRKYILKQGAEETNPPMLNIINDNNKYRTMIAIPINKKIPEVNNFNLKRMFPGKILVSQVIGGEYTASQALKQLNLYLDDNHIGSPAKPFESLVTDRSLEPDTSKWITKIYYPIY